MRPDLDRLDAVIRERARDRTHSEGCYLWSDHRDCAIASLIRYCRALEAVRDAARKIHVDDGVFRTVSAQAIIDLDNALAALPAETKEGT